MQMFINQDCTPKPSVNGKDDVSFPFLVCEPVHQYVKQNL